jgi:hypothetical protein
MSTIPHAPETAAAEEIPSPTVTHYQQVATQVKTSIDGAVALVGTLETPHTATRDFVRANAAVPLPFIVSIITAVERNSELQGIKFDLVAARDMLQFNDALNSVRDQVEVLDRTLKFTMDARKAAVAEEALHVYAAAKRYAKNPNSPLAPYVEIMKRELGRTRVHPRVKETPPAPAAGKEVPPAA